MTSDIVQQLQEMRHMLLGEQSPFVLGEMERGDQTYPCYRSAPTTLVELAAPSRLLADKTFLVYESETLSFNNFFQASDRLAAQLVVRFQIQPGDRVAIAMRNYPEWMCAFQAIVSIGAVAVPLNSWGVADELIYGLTDAKVKLLFCDQTRLSSVADYLTSSQTQAILVRGDSPATDMVSCYNELVAVDSLNPGQQAEVLDVTLDGDTTALILYTSGTTGKPKGAVSTHGAICQGIYNFNYLGALGAMTSPKTIEKMMATGFDPVALLCLPLFHVSGLHSVFLLNLHTGRKIVMMHKWDVAKALDLIESERVTSMSGVPTMTQQLLLSPEFPDRDMSSLFALGGGGMAAPPNFSEIIYDAKPDAFAGTGYGLTETNACGASSTGEAFRYKPRSTGLMSPIIELKIRDELGRIVSEGNTGEVWLRGASLMSGYWDAKLGRHVPLPDGWFNTGDLGYMDDENYLFLVDRSKDMVIRAGENIYPVEVEACALGYRLIEEVAVFGVPHEALGEELAMVVRFKQGTENVDAELEVLRQHLGKHLSAFKVPAQIIPRVSEFPKSAAGKMLKKELRAALLASDC